MHTHNNNYIHLTKETPFKIGFIRHFNLIKKISPKEIPSLLQEKFESYIIFFF